MTLESQVVSLELAKKLKELGMKQESYFFYKIGKASGHQNLVPIHDTTGDFAHFDFFSAYSVAELGEMLPTEISYEVINKRFPFNEFVTVDESNEDAYLEHKERLLEEMKEVFTALEEPENYEDGFNCGIRLHYGRNKTVSYFLNEDEWECAYEVKEVKADTEADARAKMLIYLLANKLITVNPPMKTIEEEIIGFREHFGIVSDEFQTAYEKHIEDWLTQTLKARDQEVRGEERTQIAYAFMKHHDGELFELAGSNNKEATKEYIRKGLEVYRQKFLEKITPPDRRQGD